MNILLVAINAKYIHSNLAVYSLKSYAKEYTEYIDLAEYTINHRVEYILQELYKKKAGCSVFLLLYLEFPIYTGVDRGDT